MLILLCLWVCKGNFPLHICRKTPRPPCFGCRLWACYDSGICRQFHGISCRYSREIKRQRAQVSQYLKGANSVCTFGKRERESPYIRKGIEFPYIRERGESVRISTGARSFPIYEREGRECPYIRRGIECPYIRERGRGCPYTAGAKSFPIYEEKDEGSVCFVMFASVKSIHKSIERQYIKCRFGLWFGRTAHPMFGWAVVGCL